MTTVLLILVVATLEVAAVFYLANSLPRRHWLRPGFTKFFPHTRRQNHT
jgi:hypothetical protein